MKVRQIPEMEKFSEQSVFVKTVTGKGSIFAVFKDGKQMKTVYIKPEIAKSLAGVEINDELKGDELIVDAMTGVSPEYGKQLIALCIHRLIPAQSYDGFGKVKFYNNAKNFGFVTIPTKDGEVDAFLHGSVVAKSGFIPGDGLEITVSASKGASGWVINAFTLAEPEAEEASDKTPTEDLASSDDDTVVDLPLKAASS